MEVKNMELRFNDFHVEPYDDDSLKVSGYVNRTDQPSRILGKSRKFIEKISKGAFTRALSSRSKDIDFLAEHDEKRLLASTRNGSLKLTEDENGLYMEAIITPTSWGKDTYQLIKSGLYKNMSFGFRSIKDEWRKIKGNLFERTIRELELFEVSVVKEPAYLSSTIEARGINVDSVEIPNEEITEEKDMNETIEEKLKSIEEQISIIAEGLNTLLKKDDKKEDEDKKKESEQEKETDQDSKKDEEERQEDDQKEKQKEEEVGKDVQEKEDDEKEKEEERSLPKSVVELRNLLDGLKQEVK